MFVLSAEPPLAVWYRYEDRLYAASVDEWDNPTGPPQLYVELMQLRVVKITPCGVRLSCGRFVNRSTRKRYACPTVEEARESFLARKECQLGILQTRAAHVQRAIDTMSGPPKWEAV